MNCLVTGGTGFIGSHVVDRLCEEGHDVTVVDRRKPALCDERPTVKYLLGQYGDGRLLHSTLKDVEVVYHLAWSTVPRSSDKDPSSDVTSNVLPSIRLMTFASTQKVKRFVYVSSGGAVYGDSQELPIPEDGRTNPISSYGITKLMVEKYLQVFWRQRGLDYVILRPSNPYGERQNPRGNQGMIAVSLGRVAAGVPIEVWGNGSAVKDYVYISDLVDGICRAAMRRARSRVFNLGSGRGHSVSEVLDAMVATVGKQVEVVYREGAASDVSRIYLDITRAQQQLEWQPRTSLGEGLRRTWEFVHREMSGGAGGRENRWRVRRAQQGMASD